MGKPNPTKRLPTTWLDQLVMVRDDSDELELLAFENESAAALFEACLGDSGYGSARGGYTVDYPSMDQVRKTRGYQAWLAGGQRVISMAYLHYVSDRMDSERFDSEDVSSDLLNMGTVGDAYVPMGADGDWELIFPDECDAGEDDVNE